MSTASKVEVKTATALAGSPISLARSTPLDIVLEKPLADPSALVKLLGGYKKPTEIETLRALAGKPGTKVGTVLGGNKACQVIMAAREVGGDVSLRLSRPDRPLGAHAEADLRLSSLVMMASSRFTDDIAWLVCEMAGGEETPEEMGERIRARAFRITNVVQHVSLPVSAGLVDMLRVNGFSGLSIRQPVARK